MLRVDVCGGWCMVQAVCSSLDEFVHVDVRVQTSFPELNFSVMSSAAIEHTPNVMTAHQCDVVACGGL